MIQKHFDEISKADIDELILNRTAEIKTLEYKQVLPALQDKDKKEFLADISSFANALGGDILYGVKAAVNEDGKKTGEPEAVVPIEGVTADEAKLRIESIIRTGIEPKLPVRVKTIDGYGSDGKGFVLFVRVPQSFASPHMVTFNNSSRFFCRNSAGKFQLDIHEIRNAFLATDSQEQRIRSFLYDRVGKIVANDTPVPLSADARLVLYTIPLNCFLNRHRVQLNQQVCNFSPIGTYDYNHRFNLDGLLTHCHDYNNKSLYDSYCQLFFDGVVESVYADILRVQGLRKPAKGETAFIASVAYEKYIIQAVQQYLKGYKAIGIDGPILIFMGLLGCKGAYMYVSQTQWNQHSIDRDVVTLPEVRIESLDVDVPTAMKPVFDAVWNACGYPHSYNYDHNGNWNER